MNIPSSISRVAVQILKKCVDGVVLGWTGMGKVSFWGDLDSECYGGLRK